MHVLVLGGSRNIGYLSALTFLEQGNDVTLLVRRATAFKDDAAMQKHIASGRAHVIIGDATVAADVRKALEGNPDTILYTIGGSLAFKPLPTIEPRNPCAGTMPVLLDALRAHPNGRNVRLIALSSHGLGEEGHKALPLPMKPFYKYMLAVPHEDKLIMERILGRAAGRPQWGEHAVVPEGTPDEEPWLRAVIVRPAFLTNGEHKPYRIDNILTGSYVISRKDVAHFITQECVPHWEKYEGRAIVVGY